MEALQRTLNKLQVKHYLLFALALHLLAAFFSTGFHHFDEHFQIIEFLGLKLSKTSAAHMPWEYRDMVRPWAQPFIYYCILLPFFFIKDSFIQVTILQVATSLFGLFSTIWLLRTLKELWPSKFHHTLFYCLLFTWFTPYIHARLSSENFSSSFFFLALAIFLHREKGGAWKWFLSGLLFGASYMVRYQSAIMVAFIWFCDLFFYQKNIRKSVFSALGILLIIALGPVIDYWGYGVWTFAPYNLYYHDFVKGVLADTGTSPWYEYLRQSFNRGIPPISLGLILATFYFWYKKPKDPLTWTTASSFLFFTVIGHKELRYIFPVILLTPIFAAYAYETLKDQERWRWLTKGKPFIIGLNALFLIVGTFRAANPSVNFYNFVYHSNVSHLYIEDESPFSMVGLPIYFYRKPGYSESNYKDPASEGINSVFVKKGDKILELLSNDSCELLYSSYPSWAVHFNYFNWIKRSRFWAIFNCDLKGVSDKRLGDVLNI